MCRMLLDAAFALTQCHAGVPELHAVPVSLNQNQYETVVDCRTVEQVTENPIPMLPLYDNVGYGSSSASSSLFYQYVPSKVRTLL